MEDKTITRRSVVKGTAAALAGSAAVSGSASAKSAHPTPVDGYPSGDEDKARVVVNSSERNGDNLRVIVHNPSKHIIHRFSITVTWKLDNGTETDRNVKWFLASGERRPVLFRMPDDVEDWDAVAEIEKFF